MTAKGTKITQRNGVPHAEPARPLDWAIKYDPAAAAGHGALSVTLGGQTATLLLDEKSRAEGAIFDRFGFFASGGGGMTNIYFDDLKYSAGREVNLHSSHRASSSSSSMQAFGIPERGRGRERSPVSSFVIRHLFPILRPRLLLRLHRPLVRRDRARRPADQQAVGAVLRRLGPRAPGAREDRRSRPARRSPPVPSPGRKVLARCAGAGQCSHLYQLSAIPNDSNRADTRNFSRAYRRRLSAETLTDALADITAVPDTFAGLPPGSRAMQAWTYKTESLTMDAFGRPNSSTDCPCERDMKPSIVQSLHLMNSRLLQEKLASKSGRLERLVASDLAPEQIVTEAYLACYSRLARRGGDKAGHRGLRRRRRDPPLGDRGRVLVAAELGGVCVQSLRQLHLPSPTFTRSARLAA